MRILVLGVCYSANLGDGVICECVRHILQRAFPAAQIDMADLRDRDSFSESASHQESQRNRIRRKRKLRIFLARHTGLDRQLPHEMWRLKQDERHISALCARRYDRVVFAGGQLLMDDFILYLNAYTRLFAQSGTPVYFNACGLGPMDSGAIRDILLQTLTLPNVRLISCRDHAEQMNAQFQLGKNRVIDTFDPALWTPEAYGIKRDERADCVGLGVMYPNDLSPRRVKAFWMRIIRFMEKNGMPWKMFVNGDQNDQEYARGILRAMPELSGDWEARLCAVPREPKALAETVSAFSGLLSFRLHSHIIAYALGIPSVAIVWDDKLPAFFQKIGHEERCKTIRDSSLDIIHALKNAKTEGRDLEMLSCQRKAAADLLVSALKAGL